MNGRSWLQAARTVAAVALPCGCREEGIQGAYTAGKFTMQPAGGSVTGVLAAGGSISLGVHLNFVADSFLRDAVWTYGGGELATVYTGSGVTAVVTLSK